MKAIEIIFKSIADVLKIFKTIGIAIVILFVVALCFAMVACLEVPKKNQTSIDNIAEIMVSDDPPPNGLGSVPMQDRKSNYRFNKSKGNDDLGGQSHLPGGSIKWRSESILGDGDGATPSLVVQATIDRLSFLQQTAQANGRNAKALFKLMEAKDIFDGESVELSEIHSTEEKK